MTTATFVDILLAILLPPLGVFSRFACGVEFWICLILTLLGWIPGIIYAIYVLTNFFYANCVASKAIQILDNGRRLTLLDNIYIQLDVAADMTLPDAVVALRFRNGNGNDITHQMRSFRSQPGMMNHHEKKKKKKKKQKCQTREQLIASTSSWPSSCLLLVSSSSLLAGLSSGSV
ncbi:hypothetical protein LWI29_004881 [Acer saccharum]|uniref:Uncharacterized protein n=1 Tax=Acer saccharum TaxID=4024 RepID=A0AA39SI62_ACESA|nr:hypothetical protein LWI29_004881 [Acer saccharum]